MATKLPPLRNFAPRDRRVVVAPSFGLVPEIDGDRKPVLNKAGEPMLKHDGRTQGQYRNECDINVVVNTFKRADEPFPIQRASGPPKYADLPDSTDLHSALNMVSDATNAFMTLPSHIRERYKNSPEIFLEALRTPSETDFLLDSGVLEAHEIPAAPSERVKNLKAPTGPKTPPKEGAE